MLELIFNASDPELPCHTGTLQLQGTATIEFCNELKDALLDALHNSQSLVIDVSEVTAIDVSGLQLLCAAHKSAIHHCKCLSLTKERSEAFGRQIQEAGYHCTLPTTCLRTEGQSCLWLEPVPTGNWEAL